jgi:hypothetical protein
MRLRSVGLARCYRLFAALGLIGTAPAVARDSSTERPLSAKVKQADSAPTYPNAGLRAMIAIPVSPKVSTSTWPRPGVPDYAFVAHAYGDQLLGGGLHEYDWTLQVESRSALVSLEYFRSDADIPGTPIGLFRTHIDDQAVRDLHTVVTTSKLFGRLASMAGHPRFTQTKYTLIEPPNEPSQQSIDDGDELNSAVIEPVLRKRRAMLSESFAHPERAVLLGLERTHLPEGEGFVVSMKNIGVDTICFTDPHWIIATDPFHLSVVMVAEFPGQKPGESITLDWKNLPLAPLPSRPAQEVLVTLAPGATWQAKSVAWKRTPGKEYLAQFRWASYAGDPLVNGVYRIRGRADSPRLVIEP